MDVVKLPKKVRMVCYEIMDGKEEALDTLESFADKYPHQVAAVKAEVAYFNLDYEKALALDLTILPWLEEWYYSNVSDEHMIAMTVAAIQLHREQELIEALTKEQTRIRAENGLPQRDRFCDILMDYLKRGVMPFADNDNTCCLWTRILFITLISTIMAKSWNHKYRDGGERAWTPMNKESLTEKLLDLAEGRETPETWQNWWDEHETELEALLSRGEFLKLKPRRHGFQWVPVLGSQKGAIAILEKSGTAFEASNLYHEQYLAELDAFCKEQERVQREKQKEFKANNPELFRRYPKFSKALAKALDPSDEIKPAATEEQIVNQESVLDFRLPSQVREFFLLTAGINVSTGIFIELSGTFNLTIHGERYCVLGEFWKEADGDQLLLRPGEDTIWYYAHEQDKVKRLCNDMTELLEKKLARYLNEQ